MITLVVKGNPEQALEAANSRGISAVQFSRSYQSHKWSESTLVVNDDRQTILTKIANWLCEDGVAPYPVGTLLTYSHHKEGE